MAVFLVLTKIVLVKEINSIFFLFEATQLSQAAYFALQPPYTVFGLGRTPNFVEKLIIGLPRSENLVRIVIDCHWDVLEG